MKDFRQLRVWQKGLDLAIQTYRFSATLPKIEQFGLCSQITRAAVSIPSNIAEGSSRSSDKDNNRFVEIALGSSFELETQLLIAKAVGLGNLELCDALLSNLGDGQRMLNAYQKSLNH
ncbi:four helix bundle protein [Cnuella takakiae]|uniref:Four helix bundle protein n=1 Tax=Cnuella takakiae TaxID=1302690 RepID=A0A1M4WPL9_9BACT|nr:four helix bundle protein [Cnuella takakiae]OLY91661.1 four helix bundle protein [Cnuella takakiae]SHE83003.1 four helix bundle protein [Cnuella takakiae]